MPDAITGYHGTASQNVESIKINNYRIREDKGHWIGNGVYFFINGYGQSCIDLAEKWAIAESWDNDNKRYTYSFYSILKNDILIYKNSVLNLRNPETIELLNKYKEDLKKEIEMKEYRSELNDFKVIEHLKEKYDIDIVIADVYIKFTEERITRLNSRIPNCTIISVSAKELINKDSLEEVKKGRVEDAT